MYELYPEYHPEHGYNWYWGYDGEFYNFYLLTDEKQEAIRYEFTPLRQNIVLLMAAINNEL